MDGDQYCRRSLSIISKSYFPVTKRQHYHNSFYRHSISPTENNYPIRIINPTIVTLSSLIRQYIFSIIRGSISRRFYFLFASSIFLYQLPLIQKKHKYTERNTKKIPLSNMEIFFNKFYSIHFAFLSVEQISFLLQKI